MRLDGLERALLGAISPFKGVDTLVAIEGYSFGSFSGRERLGEWGGVLRLALYRAGFKYVEVPPTSLKKFVTGKGNAKKNTMLMAVYKKWGVECADDNQGDAYSLAQFIRTGQTVPVKMKKSKKKLEELTNV